MSGVDEDDSAFSALEIMVFEVGGEVEVGAGGQGVGDEVRAAAAAEGDFVDGGF